MYVSFFLNFNADITSVISLQALSSIVFFSFLLCFELLLFLLYISSWTSKHQCWIWSANIFANSLGIQTNFPLQQWQLYWWNKRWSFDISMFSSPAKPDFFFKPGSSKFVLYTNKALYSSLCPAILRRKVLSTPRFGAPKTHLPEGLRPRRIVFHRHRYRNTP